MLLSGLCKTGSTTTPTTTSKISPQYQDPHNTATSGCCGGDAAAASPGRPHTTSLLSGISRTACAPDASSSDEVANGSFPITTTGVVTGIQYSGSSRWSDPLHIAFLSEADTTLLMSRRSSTTMAKFSSKGQTDDALIIHQYDLQTMDRLPRYSLFQGQRFDRGYRFTMPTASLLPLTSSSYISSGPIVRAGSSKSGFHPHAKHTTVAFAFGQQVDEQQEASSNPRLLPHNTRHTISDDGTSSRRPTTPPSSSSSSDYTVHLAVPLSRLMDHASMISTSSTLHTMVCGLPCSMLDAMTERIRETFPTEPIVVSNFTAATTYDVVTSSSAGSEGTITTSSTSSSSVSQHHNNELKLMIPFAAIEVEIRKQQRQAPLHLKAVVPHGSPALLRGQQLPAKHHPKDEKDLVDRDDGSIGPTTRENDVVEDDVITTRTDDRTTAAVRAMCPYVCVTATSVVHGPNPSTVVVTIERGVEGVGEGGSQQHYKLQELAVVVPRNSAYIVVARREGDPMRYSATIETPTSATATWTGAASASQAPSEQRAARLLSRITGGTTASTLSMGVDVSSTVTVADASQGIGFKASLDSTNHNSFFSRHHNNHRNRGGSSGGGGGGYYRGRGGRGSHSGVPLTYAELTGAATIADETVERMRRDMKEERRQNPSSAKQFYDEQRKRARDLTTYLRTTSPYEVDMKLCGVLDGDGGVLPIAAEDDNNQQQHRRGINRNRGGGGYR